MTRYASTATKLGLLSLLLVLALVSYVFFGSTSGVTAAPHQGGEPVVSIQPASQSIRGGETTTVEVHIADVSNLFGLDLRVSFDPAVVQVIDANPLVPGDQIEPGAFLDISGGKGFVVENAADNAAGTITYAATLLSPAEPVSGSGPLIRITFRGVAEGVSPIKLDSVLLSDPQANQIVATAEDGSIKVEAGPTVTPVPSTPVPGNVVISGVVQDCLTGAGVAGAKVRVQEAPSFAAVTAMDGSYTVVATLALPAEYTLEVTHPNYFSPRVKTTGLIQPPAKGPAWVTVNFAGVDCLPPKPTATPTITPTPTVTPTPTREKPQKLLKVDGAARFCDGAEVREGWVEIVTLTGAVVASQPVSFRGEYFFYEDFQGLEGIYKIRIRLPDGTVQFLRDATGSLEFELIDIDNDSDIDEEDLKEKENTRQLNFVGINCVQRRPVPPPKKPVPAPPVPPVKQCIYVVRLGDTLFSIARRFGTTVEAIAQANGISNPNVIKVGMKLVIPDCKPHPVPPKAECFPYKVNRGDTLYGIAHRYGTSVYALARANHIVNPWYIRTGRVLIICPSYGYPYAHLPYYLSSAAAKAYYGHYRVKPGDTLYSIALRYNTSPYKIVHINGLVNPQIIYPGQVIKVP